MQVDIHWENAVQTVLRVNCTGAWEWADMAEAIQHWEISNHTRSGNHCTIVDIRRITSLPKDAVLHLKEGAQAARDLNGQIVVLTASSATAILFKMFVTMYRGVGGKFRMATSDTEAYALLGLVPDPPSC